MYCQDKQEKWESFDRSDDKYNLAPKSNGIVGTHKGNKL